MKYIEIIDKIDIKSGVQFSSNHFLRNWIKSQKVYGSKI